MVNKDENIIVKCTVVHVHGIQVSTVRVDSRVTQNAGFYGTASLRRNEFPYEYVISDSHSNSTIALLLVSIPWVHIGFISRRESYSFRHDNADVSGESKSKPKGCCLIISNGLEF